MSLKWTIQFVVDAQLVKELDLEDVLFRKISIFFVIWSWKLRQMTKNTIETIQQDKV